MHRSFSRTLIGEKCGKEDEEEKFSFSNRMNRHAVRSKTS
jgi:hypothetical protein